MNHRQAQDLLPGYALGALELQEQEELLEHLQSCSDCYRLAQEQVEVAALLANGITAVEPPAELRGRIQDSVAEQSKPLESRIVRAEPQFIARPWFTGRLPAFALSAAASIVVALLGVILAYVVISQGDLDNLHDENVALTTKLNDQGAVGAASQAALAQLTQDNRALVNTLDQQRAALSSSQGELDNLRQASLSLSVKVAEQVSALSAAQDSLNDLLEVSDSLPPTLSSQLEALAAARETLSDLQKENQVLGAQLDEQSGALATSQDALNQLSKDNETLTARIGGQDEILGASQVALATAQQSLNELSGDNETLTARIGAQDDILAASQSDIEELREQNLALAATATNQQIFTYLQALPVTNKYVLKATTDAPGTFGILVTNVANNWGVAVLLGVDPLEPGMVYDLWLEKDGVATHGWFIKKVDPVTKFGQVYAQNFPTPVNQFDRIFVTLEPEGGSPAPTGPALLSATIN